MKLVTAISTAALVLVPVAGFAQAPANDAGARKEEPGLVEKAVEAITGRTPGTKEGAADATKQGAEAKSGDRDTAAKSAGSTDYPDRGAVKKTDK